MNEQGDATYEPIWPDTPARTEPPPTRGGLQHFGAFLKQNPGGAVFFGACGTVVITIAAFALIDSLRHNDLREHAAGPTVGLAWKVDQQEIHSPRQSRTAAWPTDQALVVAAKGAVTGLDPANGAKRWSIPFTGEICGASVKPENGRVAVLSGDGPNCDRLVVVDLNKGKKVWARALPATTPVERDKDRAMQNALRGRARGEVRDENKEKLEEVVIGDGVVALDRLGTEVEAFRLTDGRPLWHRETVSPGTDCRVSGFGGGGALLAVEKCGLGIEEKPVVHRLDPRTGRTRWTHPLSAGTEVTGVFSAHPTVLGIGEWAETKQLVLLDDNGTERKRFPVGDHSTVGCDPDRITWCQGAFVAGSTLYLPAETKYGRKFTGSLSIKAYDLATGVRKWQTREDHQNLRPFGVDGSGRLLAAFPSSLVKKNSLDRDPGQVVAIDPRNGKFTGLLSLPASLSGVDELIETRGDLSFSGGPFYLVQMTGLEARLPGILALTAKPGT